MLKISIDPHWFALIQSGKKTIEGRLATPKFGVENWLPGNKIQVVMSEEEIFLIQVPKS